MKEHIMFQLGLYQFISSMKFLIFIWTGEYGPLCPGDQEINDGNTDDVDGTGSERTGRRTVAVKVLKKLVGAEAETDFLREVEIMSAFRHDHILSLIGVVVTGKCSITETKDLNWTEIS